MQYTSTGCAGQAENILLENIISLKKKKKGKIKLRLLSNWIDCEKATPFNLVTLPKYSFWFMFINLNISMEQEYEKKHRNYLNVTHTKETPVVHNVLVACLSFKQSNLTKILLAILKTQHH